MSRDCSEPCHSQQSEIKTSTKISCHACGPRQRLRQEEEQSPGGGHASLGDKAKTKTMSVRRGSCQLLRRLSQVSSYRSSPDSGGLTARLRSNQGHTAASQLSVGATRRASQMTAREEEGGAGAHSETTVPRRRSSSISLPDQQQPSPPWRSGHMERHRPSENCVCFSFGRGCQPPTQGSSVRDISKV